MSNPPDRQALTPNGWHAVTPKIVARDAAGLVAFIRRVFDATGDYESDRPSILRIDDSPVMVGEAGPRPPSPAFLYVYVPDVDALFRRAVDAGATVVEAPVDTPYGDRRCMFEDRWRNTWQVATHAAAPTSIE